MRQAHQVSCRVVGNICSRKNKSASLPLRFDASKTLRIQRIRLQQCYLPLALLPPWCNTTSSSCGEQTSCAVCIDDFASDADDIIVLPCRHKFHTDCIVPWLTERQSKCPLCKFDVMAYCLEMEAEHHAAPEQQQQKSNKGTVISTIRGPSDRILRYRWRESGGDEACRSRWVALAPNEMDVEIMS
jgi:hypothetical protein